MKARGVVYVLLFTPWLASEELPFKSYTAADGLASNRVYHILQDSRGFLWMGTAGGLSRFDGYQFTNYPLDPGVSSPSVSEILEARSGELWLATAAGLARFNHSGVSPASRFIFYGPDAGNKRLSVYGLIQDRAGNIWCGTENGLFRLDLSKPGAVLQPVEIGLPLDTRAREVEAVFEDSRGALWIGAGPWVYRRMQDGVVERYPLENPPPGYNRIHCFREDRTGRIWAGGDIATYRFVAEPHPGRPLIERRFFPHRRANALLAASDGSFWVANSYLQQIEFSERGDVSSIHTYGRAEGFVDLGTCILAEDHNGNLWVGTYTGGAMKIIRKGFTRYGRGEGISHVRSVFEDRAGDVVIISEPQSKLHWLDGQGFHAIDIDAMKRIRLWSWGEGQMTFQAHDSEWWIPTAEGLLRFAKGSIRQLAHARPKAVYTKRDGLGSDDVTRVFEDRHGDIWISTIGAGPSGLARWERATGKIRQFTAADGLPRGIPAGTATEFHEDSDGNLWIGFYDGALARYRDGVFRLFGAAEGLPAGAVQALYVDHSLRLWLAKSSGLSRILDANSANPRFELIAAGNVRAVTEDRWGRLFLCTYSGIERLNPEDRTATYYTAADGGLAMNDPSCVLRDRAGTIWMGSAHHGLMRFSPRNDPPPTAPPILLTGLRISGKAQPVSERGQAEIAPLVLPPGQNQIQIDFVGLGFTASDAVRYQYMLEAGGHGWSAPAPERTVHLAGLPPGKYRFIVRAVTAAGAGSPQPASFAFTILPPIWQRWWFELTAALAALAAVYVAYRYRVAHLLQLERVRSRLAIDLHDDIGSGLAEIAILTEVAKTRVASSPGEVLDRVAGRARSLRESMSDIVWAVDPRLDTLGDLLRRMRQAAFGLLSAEGLEVDFLAPSDEDVEEIEIAADRRRHLLLFFKEAVTNIARHAKATRVVIELRVRRNELRLDVRDNGRGFDPQQSNGGNGLRSMRMRAHELDAELEIDSQRPGGTRIGIAAPLSD